MKLALFFTLIILFSPNVYSKSTNWLTVKAELIETPRYPPHCGVFATGFNLKFKLTHPHTQIETKYIVVSILCPEFYGKDFFKGGRRYKLHLSQSTKDDSYSFYNPYSDENLPLFTLEKIRQIKRPGSR